MNNLTKQFKTFQAIYWIMAAGQLVVGMACYFLITTGTLGAADYTMAVMLQEVALIFIPVCMATGYFLFRYLLQKIDPKSTLEEKLKKYSVFIIVRGAFFEAAFLYCCVASLITHVDLFLYMAPIVFLLFLLLRPALEAMCNDLQLTESDRIRVMAQ